jgi:protein-disulfide isomerase
MADTTRGGNLVPDRQQAEIEQLKRNQALIKRELAELRAIISAGSVGRYSKEQITGVTAERHVDVSEVSFLGDPKAPVTILEFSDYQCPYCRKHATTTLPMLVDRYINEGKVRYGIKEFPIQQLHKYARRMSEVALCAGDQGAYWKMHDIQVNNGPTISSDENLEALAKRLGIDAGKFSTCVTSGRNRDVINASLRFGSRMGIRGTPYFAIGLSDPTNENLIIVKSTISGAKPYFQFETKIDSLFHTNSN